MMFMVDPDRRAPLVRALQDAGGVPNIVNLAAEGVEAWQVAKPLL